MAEIYLFKRGFSPVSLRFPSSIRRDNNLIVKLAIEKTDCKAKETCGIAEEVVVGSEEEPCCSPTGNCC